MTAYVPSFMPYGFGPAPGADDPHPASHPPISAGDAESLLATLPGIISARVVTTPDGIVSDVHVLTGADVAPRQTVRAVESALLAEFGVRVDHRRISVATTTGPMRRPGGPAPLGPVIGGAGAPPSAPAPAQGGPTRGESVRGGPVQGGPVQDVPARRPVDARRLYFEDVEARRSARGGLSCRVVLRRGDVLASAADALVEGEAESPGTLRAQADEVAARAALDALALDALARGEVGTASFALEGSARVAAFGREFVLVGVVARQGRGVTLLTGSAEIKEGGTETAAVLAILDATNRWVARCVGGGTARAA